MGSSCLLRSFVSISVLCQVEGFVLAPSVARVTSPPSTSKQPVYSSSSSSTAGPVNATSSGALFLEERYDIIDERDLWEQKEKLEIFLREESEKSPLFPQALTMEISDVWKARFLLLGAASLYGTNFSFVKLLGDSMPVSVSSTLRFGLAALSTLPWLLQAPSEEEGDTKASFNAAAAGFEVGMWNAVGYIAQAVGLGTTEASKSAFICSLAVVVVPMLDFLCGKKLLPREIAGVILAVLGVGVLELGGSGTDFSLTSGDLCSLVQPIAFGIGFWRMEQAMRLYPQHAHRSTAAQLLAVFLASAAYGGVVGIPELDAIKAWMTDPMIWASLFWTGCITTALTVYMETLALKTLSAAETTLIFSTEPLWGAACASVVLGEQLGFGTFVGGALVLTGCVISNLGLNGLLEKEDDKDPGLTQDTTTLLPSTSLMSSTIAGATGGIVSNIQGPDVISSDASVQIMEDVKGVINNAAEGL